MEIILILLKDVFNGDIEGTPFLVKARNKKIESMFYSRNEERTTDQDLDNFNKHKYKNIFTNFNKYITEKLNGVNVELKCMTSKNYNLYTIPGNSKKDFDIWTDIYIYMLHLKKLFGSEINGGYVFEAKILEGYDGEFAWLDDFENERAFIKL